MGYNAPKQTVSQFQLKGRYVKDEADGSKR